ncbi:MAG: S-layer homology domain-containing protein, partial [Clostridia bacterium]|nr:S-layer homology domain-containing protein [Clostridia bacterium]
GIMPLTSFASDPAIAVSTVSGTPGKEVSVTVTMTGNPGVCAGRLAVSYGEYLELTGVTDGGVLSGGYFGNNKSDNPYYVTWDDTLAAKDNVKNGVLVTLKFRIRSDAPSGSQPVIVSHLPGDFVNVSLKNVPFKITNGAVKVRSGALAHFADVDPDAYYADAVSWAVRNNITKGTDETHFSPNAGCTRAQVVTFLWRSAGEPEPTTAKNPFRDVLSDQYYYKAVLWAVENGITKGTDETHFSPNATCTRGQIVTFLYRWKGSPKPTSSKNPFADVKSGDYFFDAVLWAVGNEITNGTDKTHFSPNATCTRAQVVTFLKRSDDSDGKTSAETQSDGSVIRDGAAQVLLGRPRSSDSSASRLVEKLVSGMREFAESIDVSEFALDDDRLQWAFQEIINTVPDLFYVNIRYTYTQDPETGEIYKFFPEYTITDTEQIKRMKAEYEAEIEAVCSLVDRSWSDLEKALFVHDYVLTGFEYDTSYAIHDVYNFFKEKRGVCQAYTLLYIEILKRFGIEVDAVISTAMNHTWNRVKIGGKWYHVDLAWDDPIPDQLGSAVHTYFLVSDEYISSSGDGRDPHYGWKGYGDDITCTDKSYEAAIWHGVTTPFVPLNGSWYFIGNSGSGYAIMKTSDLKKPSVVRTLPEMWSSGTHGYYWLGYFSGLCDLGGVLVYNTPREIVSFDPATGIANCLYRLPEGGHDLYGVTLRGEIFYAVQSGPTAASDFIAAIPPAARYDADADGYIVMRDLAFLRRYLKGEALIVNKTGADADGNGTVDSADVPVLKAYLAGN